MPFNFAALLQLLLQILPLLISIFNPPTPTPVSGAKRALPKAVPDLDRVYIRDHLRAMLPTLAQVANITQSPEDAGVVVFLNSLTSSDPNWEATCDLLGLVKPVAKRHP